MLSAREVRAESPLPPLPNAPGDRADGPSSQRPVVDVSSRRIHPPRHGRRNSSSSWPTLQPKFWRSRYVDDIATLDGTQSRLSCFRDCAFGFATNHVLSDIASSDMAYFLQTPAMKGSKNRQAVGLSLECPCLGVSSAFCLLCRLVYLAFCLLWEIAPVEARGVQH